MKRFFKILVCFSFVLLIASTIADFIITSGLRKSDLRKYVVWNEIFQGGIDADVLILGSSRAWCAYNTRIVDSMLQCNSYNLGLDGHTLEYQILRYNTYCRFNKKPRMVILNVDFYSTLGATSDAQYEREQFFPYILDDSLMTVIAGQKHLTLFDRYVPLYRYIGYRDDCEIGILSFLGVAKSNDGGLYKGYRGNDWNWREPSDVSTIHKLEYEDASLLDDFISNLVGDGIEVIMVKQPFHDWMYEHYDGEEIIDEEFQDIATQYGILLLDYYHGEISHDTLYFYNPSHLNKLGGDIFTRDMCIDIKKHKNG